MEFYIYDFADSKALVKTRDEEVIDIYVQVLSGDEVVYINYSIEEDDVDEDVFDSSDCRVYDFFDGDYIVPKEKIEEWINFSCEEDYAYERLKAFDPSFRDIDAIMMGD